MTTIAQEQDPSVITSNLTQKQEHYPSHKMTKHPPILANTVAAALTVTALALLHSSQLLIRFIEELKCRIPRLSDSIRPRAKPRFLDLSPDQQM